MSAAAKPAVVCVTGASGFIAGHIVAQLLEQGYIVHGTVRSLSNDAAVGYVPTPPPSFTSIRRVLPQPRPSGTLPAFASCLSRRSSCPAWRSISVSLCGRDWIRCKPTLGSCFALRRHGICLLAFRRSPTPLLPPAIVYAHRYLRQLPGAPERLKLFEADLLRAGSFKLALAGCEGVYHTARCGTTSATAGTGTVACSPPELRPPQPGVLSPLICHATPFPPPISRVLSTHIPRT